MAHFSKAERQIQKHFVAGNRIQFQNHTYEIRTVGKPTCPSGEPKTDIYILLVDCSNDTPYEIKISYKKSNADFLENKIKAERAEQLFGNDWRDIIQKSTMQIQHQFENKKLIFKSKFGRTEKGAITLGWKFELMNKLSGELSGQIILSHQQYQDVLSGNNLSIDKKNAFVNGKVIPNSGVANYILTGDDFNDVEDVLSKLESIDEYIQRCPNIYFACKALNYRTFKSKYDGNRSLAVQVEWSVQDNKLVPNLVFDRPLTFNGLDSAKKLLTCLQELGVKNTDDIHENNCLMRYVYE